MRVLAYILTAVIAYLLGSIPTGFLVAKARGIDIRSVGSGNIGATNTFRVLGKAAGTFVLLSDGLKGWLAVAVAAPLVGRFCDESQLDYLRVLAGMLAIVGHNYTCWLKFKGGKGIATSAGVIGALLPWALLIIVLTWLLLLLLTRYVSVASIGAAALLPVAAWFTTGHNVVLTIVTIALSALAIWRHRNNIQRLMHGTENRFQFRRKEAAP